LVGIDGTFARHEICRHLVAIDANRVGSGDLERDIADELLEIFVRRGFWLLSAHLYEHAHLAARVNVRGYETVVLYLDALASPHLDVLADLLNRGDALRLEICIRAGCDLPGEVVAESFELLVLRYEVRLAVYFDQDACLRAGKNGLGDDALFRLAIGLFGSARRPLLAEDVDGRLHVAIGLGKSSLAFHQAGVGLFPEGLDRLRVDYSGGHR
jgi:hypothetical protein